MRYGHIKKPTASIGGRIHTYASKEEMIYAGWLALQHRRGLIQSWSYEGMTRQNNWQKRWIRFDVPKQNKIKGTYVDFHVVDAGGVLMYHEFKGRFDKASQVKIKLLEEKYGDRFLLVSQREAYWQGIKAMNLQAIKKQITIISNTKSLRR